MHEEKVPLAISVDPVKDGNPIFGPGRWHRRIPPGDFSTIGASLCSKGATRKPACPAGWGVRQSGAGGGFRLYQTSAVSSSSPRLTDAWLGHRIRMDIASSATRHGPV